MDWQRRPGLKRSSLRSSRTREVLVQIPASVVEYPKSCVGVTGMIGTRRKWGGCRWGIQVILPASPLTAMRPPLWRRQRAAHQLCVSQFVIKRRSSHRSQCQAASNLCRILKPPPNHASGATLGGGPRDAHLNDGRPEYLDRESFSQLAGSFLFGRKGQRHLGESISPAARRSHIGITEPDLAVEFLALPRSLDPQQRGHHCRVAP